MTTLVMHKVLKNKHRLSIWIQHLTILADSETSRRWWLWSLPYGARPECGVTTATRTWLYSRDTFAGLRQDLKLKLRTHSTYSYLVLMRILPTKGSSGQIGKSVMLTKIFVLLSKVTQWFNISSTSHITCTFGTGKKYPISWKPKGPAALLRVDTNQ